MIRDPVETELPYRSELSSDQIAELVEWTMQKKYKGDIRARGTDPNYPGSIFWKCDGDLRITPWPEQERIWAIHNRKEDPDVARIIRYLKEVLATHPPTQH